MEEPIVTFGSESLILEMFPESTQKPMPELLLEPTHTIPDSITVQISPEHEPEPKKRWCVIS